MSNNKQSSVEYLMQLLFDPSWKSGIEIQKQWFEKAKQLHKEEIMQAWKMGDGKFDNVAKDMSCDYYNETYGGNK